MDKSLEKQDKPLTPKQKRFCEEYLIDLNATQSAIRAGYSEKTAESIGWENLRKPLIQEYIAEKQKEVQERTKVSVDFVINGIKEIALKGAKEENRLRAFDMLGRHLGVYEKDNNQSKPEAILNITRKYLGTGD